MNIEKCKFCGIVYTQEEKYIYSICYICNKCFYEIIREKYNKKITYITIYFYNNTYINNRGHKISIDYLYKKIVYTTNGPEYKFIVTPIPFIKFEEIEDLEAFKNRVLLYIKMI